MKLLVRHFLLAAVLTVPAWSMAATEMGPAPDGEPRSVAKKALKDADHPCPKVVSARRMPDGSISAMCSNKEDYRISTVQGQSVALRCSAARKFGITGC